MNATTTTTPKPTAANIDAFGKCLARQILISRDRETDVTMTEDDLARVIAESIKAFYPAQ